MEIAFVEILWNEMELLDDKNAQESLTIEDDLTYIDF